VFEGGVCWTPPALSGGRLFVRNQRHAACIVLGAAARGGPTATVAELREASRQACETADRWARPALSVPTWDDLVHWYVGCIILLGAALAVGASTGRFAVALALLFALGGAGMPLWHTQTGAFVFTWPLCLFAALQAALLACVRGRSAWRGRAAILALLGVCGAYYVACTAWFIVAGYGFLTGLLPGVVFAWPVAAWRRRWAPFLLSPLAFTAFFWASAAFIMWKTRL